ncbi:bifunctional folylpolyglutamate synthase/dihydrofolate synthase [Sulfurimonas sp. MAG313]|nr:Mur ligase family protein [Sulfurimonas sp. MAG313]MDF1881732.1 bifunctional folylpolyglutamate synthase/dihydrofolate synthase [Sulfurimonas sp. MAG313]
MTLNEFLEKKPLYYKKIDYTRMPRAYASIKDKLFIPPVIHLVGTNAKGTTGRFLANALSALDFKVGHYSSPHIKEFNERIWLNGKNCDEGILEKAHEILQTLLSEDFKNTLSYFEYTTFLAMIVYKDCDYIILEAGLGGEYDATNAFEKILSVITPIGLDHEEFLGSSIKEIAQTKLRSVSSKAILGEQRFKEVLEVANEISRTSSVEFIYYKDKLSQEDIYLSEVIVKEKELPHYLQDNLLLCMSVVKELGYEIKKNLFNSQPLEGRMERIQTNIWLDVGHNTLAAEAISHSFAPNSINLVYNSYKDKDYLSILSILAPIIRQVEIIDIDDERMALRKDLEAAICKNNLSFKKFETIHKDENYLVFGSFRVVEAFKTRF